MAKKNAKEFLEKNKGKIITGFVVIGLTTAAAIVGYRNGFKLGVTGEFVPMELADTKAFGIISDGNQNWTMADFGKFGEEIIDSYKEFGFSKDSIVKGARLFLKTK